MDNWEILRQKRKKRLAKEVKATKKHMAETIERLFDKGDLPGHPSAADYMREIGIKDLRWLYDIAPREGKDG